MTRTMRWLAAVAGLALVAGSVSSAEATTRARPAVHAKAKAKKRIVRRRAARGRTAAVARPERQPDGDSAQIARSPRPAGAEPPALVTRVPPVDVPAAAYAAPYAPPAPDPAPVWADYRWLDDADAMIAAIGPSAPDRVFAENRRDARYFWQLPDGAIIIAEPQAGGDRRWYFYARDTTVPFLVRTPDDSYGYERGRLAALYDRSGAAQPWRPGDSHEREAADLLDRGRRLWFAARSPAPPPPRAQLSDWSLFFDWGADWRGWQENDGWRAWRRGPGYDHRRTLDDRYRREREDRAARAARGDGWNGYGAGGPPPPGGAQPPRSGQAGPGRPGRGTAPPVAAQPVPPSDPVLPPPREMDAPIGDTSRVPRDAPGAVERGPAGERPTRGPARAEVEAPVTDAPAVAPERPPRMREPEAEAAPREPVGAAPAPEPMPQSQPEPRPEPTPPPPPRAAPPPEPEAAPPPRAAPSPEPAAQPAPPPAEPERQERARPLRENERPE